MSSVSSITINLCSTLIDIEHTMGSISLITWFFLLLFSSSLIRCEVDTFDQSLEGILHDHAFRVMMHHRPHTGALYNASPPANLTGMKVSVVGLRSRTLWKQGANFSDFVIPPQTLPVPYVKRLLIVYHDLGNWSTSYYSLAGYALTSPVVGFLVYDASHLRSRNLSKIELNTNGKPVVVEFQNSTLVIDKRRKCANFGTLGEVLLSEMRLPNVCYSTSSGHFAIVIPSKQQQQKRIWPFWVFGSLVGFVVLIMVGITGVMAVRSFVGRRNQEMEKEADDAECLQTYWIDSGKIPRAEPTRTQPVLESTTLPNPKLSWYG